MIPPPTFLGLRKTEPFKHTWKINVKSTLKLFVVTIDHKIELDTKSLWQTFTLERLFQYLTLTTIRKVSKYFYTKPVQSSFNIMDVLHKRMEKPVLESTRSTARLVIPSRYFLVHCQLSKHLKNLQNLFKVNNKFTHSGLENEKDNFKAAKRQLQKMILKKKKSYFWKETS